MKSHNVSNFFFEIGLFIQDCGNGWWNATTSKCDYWIPPPDPTPAPTVACPVCEECSALTATSFGSQAALRPAIVGGILGVIVGAAVVKFGFSNRRSDYDRIPN